MTVEACTCWATTDRHERGYCPVHGDGSIRPSLPEDAGTVERVAKAIYDAPDNQSGDYVGTVIYNSEHLFPEIGYSETEADATRRTAMDVCRDAARAAIRAMKGITD